MEEMKIVNVAIALGILVSAAISSAAVMGLVDSDNDGIIDRQVSEVIAKTPDKVVAVALADLKVQAEGNASNADPVPFVPSKGSIIPVYKVQAEGNAANADPGGTGNANILVLVTNKGAPVDDLTRDDFKLKTILSPPGGGAVRVKEFYNYDKGAYTFSVLPIKNTTWGAGEYDIQIRVRVFRGGQAIAAIEVE